MRDLLTAAAARGEIRAGVDIEAASRAVNVLMIGIGDSACSLAVEDVAKRYGSVRAVDGISLEVYVPGRERS